MLIISWKLKNIMKERYNLIKDWEPIFRSWSTGPSKSEQDRIENTEKMIKSAIESSDKLKNSNIKIFI